MAIGESVVMADGVVMADWLVTGSSVTMVVTGASVLPKVDIPIVVTMVVVSVRIVEGNNSSGISEAEDGIKERQLCI